MSQKYITQQLLMVAVLLISFCALAEDSFLMVKGSGAENIFKKLNAKPVSTELEIDGAQTLVLTKVSEQILCTETQTLVKGSPEFSTFKCFFNLEQTEIDGQTAFTGRVLPVIR